MKRTIVGVLLVLVGAVTLTEPVTGAITPTDPLAGAVTLTDAGVIPQLGGDGSTNSEFVVA
jgi:hypothetical protein